MDDRREPACHKVVTIMTVFLLITQVSVVASQRNRSISANDAVDLTHHNYYLWKTSFKTDEKCVRFRPENAHTSFFVWPEDQPQFRYCCGVYNTTNLSLVTPRAPLGQHYLGDYLYHQHGPSFQLGYYYDVVIIDECMPYWKCWRSEPLQTTNDITFQMYCETGDLRRFYNHRFWTMAVLVWGLLSSALPLIVLLEGAVLLCTVFLRRWIAPSSTWKQIFRIWWRGMAVVKLRSWFHLALLTVVGNCFMESVAHSSFCSWEASILTSFAFVYLILPLVEWVSAFLQQLTDWRLAHLCIVQHCRMEDVKKKLQLGLHDNDWKWRPIFLNIAVFALLVLFCRYTLTASRTEFVEMLVSLASMAATWSLLVSVIISFRKFKVLVESFHSDFELFNMDSKLTQV